MKKPVEKYLSKYKWFMKTELNRGLTFFDKLKLLFGKKYSVYFFSPNGECNASCIIEIFEEELGR